MDARVKMDAQEHFIELGTHPSELAQTASTSLRTPARRCVPAVPAWHPFWPGWMCRGRSASVILTSPPLRAAEVRITTAPLRKGPLREPSRIAARKASWGCRSVPVTEEGASKTSAGDGGSCTGRRAFARHFFAPRFGSLTWRASGRAACRAAGRCRSALT
jgi:hypothetical protein